MKKKLSLKRAEVLAREVKALIPGHVEICGSIRRRETTIGDIDVATTVDLSLIAKLPYFRLVSGGSKTITFIYKTVQVNCYRYDEKYLGAMRLFLTGPGQYNIKLRRLAAQRKLKLNQYGLWQGSKCVTTTEWGIHHALDLNYRKPNRR